MQTKDDFVQYGAQCAAQNMKPSYLRDSKSWQAKAAWKGYDDAMALMFGDKKDANDWAIWKDGTPTKGEMKGHGIYAPPNFQGWPVAAAEHARKLADDIFEGKGSPQRLTRLLRKLDVLRLRHGIVGA